MILVISDARSITYKFSRSTSVYGKGCKDDKETMMETMLNVDAVIILVPICDLMSTATISKFLYRNLSYEAAFLEAIEYKDRIGTLIAVGGATH